MNSWTIARRVIQSIVVAFVAGVLLVGCFGGRKSSPVMLVDSARPTAAIATEPAQPTVKPEPSQGVSSFSLETADWQRPGDVLEVVSFFGGGGAAICFDEIEPTLIYFGVNIFELVAVLATQSTNEDIYLISCRWTNPGLLNVIVELPNGTSLFDTVEATPQSSPDMNMASYKLDLGLDPPVGNYRFAIGNPTEAVWDEFWLERPVTPKLFRLADGSVVLWNFIPSERVRVIAYSEMEGELYTRQGQFVASQEYRTSPDGSLYVEVTSPIDAFAAIGEFTGEIAESHTYSEVVLPIRQ